MVQLDRKEIVDFLNEKADVITNFVQAQEELSNVENVWFSAEEVKVPNKEETRLQLYCYIEFNEFIQSYSEDSLQWALGYLGLKIFKYPDDMGKNLLRFAVMDIVAQPIVVRRNYDVLVAEAAIRAIQENGNVIGEDFEDKIGWAAEELSKEEGYSDLLQGGEFDADLSPSYGVF